MANPDLKSVYFKLGVAYGELKKFDQAIVNYRKAAAAEPDNASAWLSLGYAYDLDGSTNAASGNGWRCLPMTAATGFPRKPRRPMRDCRCRCCSKTNCCSAHASSA